MLPEAGRGLGQGQRAVEVAPRVRRATSSAGSTPICATSAPTPSSRLVEPLLADPDTVLVKASYTRLVRRCARRRRARAPSSSPARCCRCCSRSCADIVQPLGGEYAARRDALEVAAVRRGLGRRARAARRRRRALRPRRDRAGRPRARASTATGPSPSSSAQSLAIIATALRRARPRALRRPDARAAPLRPRRQPRRRAGRDPRAPTDHHLPRLPRRFTR